MTLPHDLAAEANVLGACLTSVEDLQYTCNELVSDDFYQIKNKKLFEILSKMNQEEQHVDIVTVDEKYKDLEFLANLATGIITNANLRQHVKIIKAKSIRRLTIQRAKQVIDISENGSFSNLKDYQNECNKLMDIDIKEKNERSKKICDVANDYLNYIEKAMKEGEKTLYKMGVDWLDKEMGGMREELTFIAALTSVGKTACAINITKRLSEQGLTGGFFSIEMSNKQVMDRLVTIHSKVQQDDLVKPWQMNDYQIQKVCEAINHIMRTNLFLYEDLFDIESIRQECRRIKKENGRLDFIFIDHLHIMKTLQKIDNDVKRIEHLTRELVLMKKEFKCAIFCLAQFNREACKDQEPRMHHLKGGSSIEQDADNVIILVDPDYGNEEQEKYSGGRDIKIVMAKQRNGERDIYGWAKFYKKTQKFI